MPQYLIKYSVFGNIKYLILVRHCRGLIKQSLNTGKSTKNGHNLYVITRAHSYMTLSQHLTNRGVNEPKYKI